MALVDNYTKEELEKIVQESNSYKDLVLKLGYNSKGGNTYKTVQNRIEKYNIDTSHFYQQEKIERNPDNIFIKNSTAGQNTLRKYYFRGNYSEYKCAICGLPPEWQGKPLTLTLDHINGDHQDDRIENLRWVCPNCDRQLPTYSKGLRATSEIKKCPKCGKPIGKKSTLCVDCTNAEKLMTALENRPVSRDELKNLIRTTSFVDIGKRYNCSDNAIRKWCDKFNLPRTKKEINSYSEDEWSSI